MGGSKKRGEQSCQQPELLWLYFKWDGFGTNADSNREVSKYIYIYKLVWMLNKSRIGDGKEVDNEKRETIPMD